jgi:hypothetical protein
MSPNNKKTFWLISFALFLLVLSFCSGCKTLLPSGQETSTATWKTYAEAEQTFKRIIPSKTTKGELEALGIDFNKTPNLKSLTYLDVMERFKLDSTVFNKLKLPPGIEGALNKHEKCLAYELNLEYVDKRRVGGFWKDLLAFEQVTQRKGWAFNALIVMVDDTVIYVLYSGSPKINTRESNKQPLGPFQGIDAGAILDAAK